LAFDGNATAALVVPSKFAGQMTGICGDCNKQPDDFKTRAGTDVSDKDRKDVLIGDSFRVLDDSDSSSDE